jgi:hypothetical protein
MLAVCAPPRNAGGARPFFITIAARSGTPVPLSMETSA